MLKPVKAQSLSNQVFEQLRNNILNKSYSPGERLPSERELCVTLQANRGAIREALKRLEQARLIEIRQGDGSIVLDFQFNAGFDMMADLLLSGDSVNYLAVRSIIEFRALIGVEVARLAAIRIEEPELIQIEEIVKKIKVSAKDNFDEFLELDWEFYYTMARASQNIAFVLMFNSVRDTYFKFRTFFTAVHTHSRNEPEIYQEIFEALKSHDPENAKRLCAEMIETGNNSFMALFPDQQE